MKRLGVYPTFKCNMLFVYEGSNFRVRNKHFHIFLASLRYANNCEKLFNFQQIWWFLDFQIFLLKSKVIFFDGKFFLITLL